MSRNHFITGLAAAPAAKSLPQEPQPLDCLYTGPASDSIDCWAGPDDPHAYRRQLEEQRHQCAARIRDMLLKMMQDRYTLDEITRIETKQSFGGFADLFDISEAAEGLSISPRLLPHAAFDWKKHKD